MNRRRLWRWMAAIARERSSPHQPGAPLGTRVLPGLRVAASTFRASMQDLGTAATSVGVDARRLCAASYSAGRLVGYLEALEAADARLADVVTSELHDAMQSVDDVRRRFERGTR